MWSTARSKLSLLSIIISSTGPLVSAAWMGTVLLTYGLFLSHTGEFTRFLHRRGGAYFLYSLGSPAHAYFLQSSSIVDFAFLESLQEDSIFFHLFFYYSTFLRIIFFFGRSTRFAFTKRTPREFPILILFVYLGGLFLLRFSTFIDLLLALETITLASYVLVAFERQNRYSTYASIQYFLVGSIPSARFLLGLAFFYLQGGSLVVQDLDLFFSGRERYTNSLFSSFSQENLVLFNHFFSENNFKGHDEAILSNFTTNVSFFGENRSEALLSTRVPTTTLSRRGFLFVCFNLFFKITAAPFHFWAPSVYGKAPIASVTFLSIYSKVRALFFLFSILTGFFHFASSFVLFFFLVSGLLSLLVGRIGAFTEKRIKRFFVFSSRGHVGFRLAGYSLFSFEGFASVFHYIPVYRVSSFLRWYILFSRGRENAYLIQFSAFKQKQPLLAIFFGFLLFSRSGIPPFAGFFVKLDVLSALFDSSHFFVNYIFFFFTVASFFYYLRAIKILFFDQSSKENVSTTTLNFSQISSDEIPRSESQYWIRSTVFLFLLFYIFFVQKPLFLLQNERLLSRIQ